MSWYGIVHSPEIWLAAALFSGGAAAGIGISWIVWALNEKEDDHERH